MSSGLHRPSTQVQQPQYVHYTGPQQQLQPPQHQPMTVSPQDTQRAPPKPAVIAPRTQAQVHNGGSSNIVIASSNGAGPSVQTQPVVAKGNWTKDLVQLAKTAELKKHALTLQLHTAHILSAHASLEQKNRAIQDIREQRNKLESERQRLIECLAQVCGLALLSALYLLALVNEDRNQADLLETTLDRERNALRTKIGSLSEGEYKAAKTEVDRLRSDLGQPPLPSLQETLDGKGAGRADRSVRVGRGVALWTPTAVIENSDELPPGSPGDSCPARASSRLPLAFVLFPLHFITPPRARSLYVRSPTFPRYLLARLRSSYLLSDSESALTLLILNREQRRTPGELLPPAFDMFAIS
ncbi:hypothetical protein C8R47DRAFT_1218635 [Mycena vitilis]|nr:hypothetical protein C8R47DRAFT_1218635 [Mycena vitilis]